MAAGARRLVLLSGRGEEGADRAEERLKRSGADRTVVRANWFARNFGAGLFPEPVMAGEPVLPVGDAVEPFGDADDIADVAVVALTDPGTRAAPTSCRGLGCSASTRSPRNCPPRPDAPSPTPR